MNRTEPAHPIPARSPPGPSPRLPLPGWLLSLCLAGALALTCACSEEAPATAFGTDKGADISDAAALPTDISAAIDSTPIAPADASPPLPKAPPVPCATDTDCPGSKCLPSEHICAECLADAECGTGSICQSGQCSVGTRCSSDAGCKATAQVCSKATLACVDCNSNVDCPAPLKCGWGRCVQACLSSKECPAVCHPTAQVCAQCGDSAECGSGKACVEGSCQPAWCQADLCVGTTALQCKDGRFVAAKDCTDKNQCTIDSCIAGKGCWHEIAPPGGIEVLDDGVDNDCDGVDDESTVCPAAAAGGSAGAGLAEAAELCGSVTSTLPVAASPAAVVVGPGKWFVVPELGNSLAVISTGQATPDVATNPPTQPGNFGKSEQISIPGPCGVTAIAHDLTEWRVELKAPKAAQTLEFSLNFATAEDPAGEIDDRLLILVESAALKQNVAVLPSGQCVGTHAASWATCSSSPLGLYGIPELGWKAATGWFRIAIPVQGDAPITLRFIVFDDDDAKVASTAFIDAFAWSAKATPAPKSWWLDSTIAVHNFAKGPAPVPPKASPQCEEFQCKGYGFCSWNGSVCVAVADSDCKQSNYCKGSGWCSLVDSKCLPVTPADCQNSFDCNTNAHCSPSEGKCKLLTDQDCKYGSNCEMWGRCKKSGEACIAVSDADCYFSFACMVYAGCTASKGKCCDKAGKCY